MSTAALKAVTTGKAAITKPQTAAQWLEDAGFKRQIAAALPRHMTAERMTRIALTELRKVPALGQCEPKSFLGAVVQTAQLGLEPGNSLGHAYILPYGKQAQLIIGYRGMIDLARRSGQIISLNARAVHVGDEFDYQFGLHEDLKHVPQADPGAALTHVYAVAKLKDGGIQFEVMTRAEIEAVRAQSKAGKSGPWVTHFEEMAKKTVIRRLFKYLPVSIEVQRAVSLDEQAEAGIPQGNEFIIEGEAEQVTAGGDPAVETGEITGNPERNITYAMVAEKINAATDADALDIAADLITEVKDEAQQAELRNFYQARKGELAGE